MILRVFGWCGNIVRVELTTKRITHFSHRKTRVQTLVRREAIKKALARTLGNVVRNHKMQMAAALSYYFVLSLFLALIFLSAVAAYLPVPDLFNQALGVMARFIPSDSMGLVRRVLADVITPNRETFLSFGILGSFWAASGGFAAAIEALNVAYEASDDRPFWPNQLLRDHIQPLALKAGFLKIGWHRFRHTVSASGKEAGFSLGSQDTSEAREYCHYVPELWPCGARGKARIAEEVGGICEAAGSSGGPETPFDLAAITSSGTIQYRLCDPCLTHADFRDPWEAFEKNGSSGRTRTYNPPVNSRMLCH